MDTFIQGVRLAEIHVSTKLSKLAAIPRGDTSAGSEGRARSAPSERLILSCSPSRRLALPVKGTCHLFFFNIIIISQMRPLTRIPTGEHLCPVVVLQDWSFAPLPRKMWPCVIAQVKQRHSPHVSRPKKTLLTTPSDM